MGFMSGAGAFAQGFGDAFSKSYGQTLERRSRKEELEANRKIRREELDLNFENDKYLKLMDMDAETQKELAAQKKKDAAMVSEAQTISDTYGVPLEVILPRLQSGSSRETVIDLVQKNKITRTIPVADVATSVDPTVAQTNEALFPIPGLDENTWPKSTPIDAVPPIVDQPITSNVAGRDIGGFIATSIPEDVDIKQAYENALAKGKAGEAEAERLRPMVEELAKVGRVDSPDTLQELYVEREKARASGDTAEETILDNAIKANEAGILKAEAAKAGSQEIIVNNEDGSRRMTVGVPRPDGNLVDFSTGKPLEQGSYRTMTEQEGQEVKNIRSIATSIEIRDYNKKLGGLTSGIRSADKLFAMVDDEKLVLSPIVGRGLDIVNTSIIELKNLAGLVDQEAAANDIPSEENIKQLEDILAGINISKISNAAEKRAIFEAEINILAYRMGAVEGQSGAAFGEKDYNRIAQTLKGTSDPEAFKIAVADYMNSNINSTRDSAAMLNEYNSQVNQFESDYGWRPVNTISPTIDQFINEKGDQQLKSGFSKVMKYADKKIGVETKIPIVNSREEMLKLEPGTTFIAPDGNRRTVPPR